jgi:hypothetical protein
LISPNKIVLIGACAASAAVSCVGGDLSGEGDDTSGGLISAGLDVITVVSSGKCLDVVGGGLVDGVGIEQRDCDGSKNQQWNLRSAGSGVWEIASASSGKCLDVTKMSLLDGARIQQWACHGGDNQHWKLNAATGTQVQVQSVSSSKCLDVAGVSMANGALIQQWACGGGTNQRFTFTTAGGGGGGSGGISGGSGGSGGTAGGSGGASGGTGGASGTPGGPLTGAGHISIQHQGSTFTLLRDGQPYLINGIAGGAHLDVAQRSGANSLRLYSSSGAARSLDSAKANGMTLLLGIGLDSNPAQYTNDTFKNGKRAEVVALLSQVKDHPALLMWALGNEINLGADTQAAWQFVDELATTIHQQDPNHPVMTVIAGDNATAMNHVALWAPHIDVLGVNAYKRAPFVDGVVKGSNFAGPYVVTEFGPTGHWESTNTSWNMPIEQVSGDKALAYQQRYQAIVSHRDRALGSYVFLWAQKEERTPTWYGMFLENLAALPLSGESCPTVDAMAFSWSGRWPANRAPTVSALAIDGKSAEASVTLTAGQTVQAQVIATEPDGDAMKFIWEILQDTDVQSGGSSSRPARVGTPQTGSAPTLTVSAPTTAGLYRLYVYVLDGKGHAGTANLPFRVN